MNFNVFADQTFLTLKVFHWPYRYENFKSQILVVRILTKVLNHFFELPVPLRKVSKRRIQVVVPLRQVETADFNSSYPCTDV